MPGTRPVKSLGGLLHPGPGHDYGRTPTNTLAEQRQSNWSLIEALT